MGTKIDSSIEKINSCLTQLNEDQRLVAAISNDSSDLLIDKLILVLVPATISFVSILASALITARASWKSSNDIKFATISTTIYDWQSHFRGQIERVLEISGTESKSVNERVKQIQPICVLITTYLSNHKTHQKLDDHIIEFSKEKDFKHESLKEWTNTFSSLAAQAVMHPNISNSGEFLR